MELAFFCFGIQFYFAKSLQYFLDMFSMLENVVGVNQNIV